GGRVAGEGEAAHGADEEGDQAEDGDLDEDLAAGGGSEEGEASNAGGFEVVSHAAQAVTVATLDAPERDDHEEGQVAAGHGGGEAGSGDAQGGDADWAPRVAEDQQPVADRVDDVGGDESDSDRTDVVEGLQIAA